MKRLFAMLVMMFTATSVAAIEKLEVQALFANKAVLMIDGKRHILAVGAVSPEGVKVISADAHGAVLEVDGKQKQYLLGNTVSTSFTKRETSSEKIFVNSGGMYMTIGTINGRSVRFLLDTGASAVAMNKQQAKSLGIKYKRDGVAAGVSTASGYEKAYRVKLRSVSVGSITQKNVEGFVIEGSHPGPILLGMSFLGQLKVERDGTAMTLTQDN